MNVQQLVDSIIRDTTILVAKLAAFGGVDAPLTEISGKVFIDARDNDEQGVSQKVIAEARESASRHRHQLASQIDEGSPAPRRSLRESIFDLLRAGQSVSHTDIVSRFPDYDGTSIRRLLDDLVAAGFVFATGSGRGKRYVLPTHAELELIFGYDSKESKENLLWAIIYREGTITDRAIKQHSNLEKDELEQLLSRLLEKGRIIEEQCPQGILYRARGLAEEYEEISDTNDWESALHEHFQAVAITISSVLMRERISETRDASGIGTYTFVIWQGHPLEREVETQLDRYRRNMTDLRRLVDEYNERQGAPSKQKKVVSYFGQLAMEKQDSATVGTT